MSSILRLRWFQVVVGLLAVLVVGLVVLRRDRQLEVSVLDLIERFPDAQKRTTMGTLHDGFAVVEVTIAGETKRCIFAHPFSRINWVIEQVPPNAVLKTMVGMRQESWSDFGDGALFRVGVSDGERYEEFFKQTIDPYNVETDRRWFPVEVDLLTYAGRRVEVIFNTEPGPHGNSVADAALWGDPRLEWANGHRPSVSAEP